MRNLSVSSKNIATLLTGTAISQLIPIIISPILTRLYTPTDFGDVGVFIGLASVLAILSSGRYELAIVLPKDDFDAYALTWLCVILTLFFSSLLCIFLFIMDAFSLLSSFSIDLQSYKLLLPIGILFLSLYQAFYYLSNRRSHYKIMSLSRMTQAFALSGSQISLGISGVRPIGLNCRPDHWSAIVVGSVIKKPGG